MREEIGLIIKALNTQTIANRMDNKKAENDTLARLISILSYQINDTAKTDAISVIVESETVAEVEENSA